MGANKGDWRLIWAGQCSVGIWLSLAVKMLRRAERRREHSGCERRKGLSRRSGPASKDGFSVSFCWDQRKHLGQLVDDADWSGQLILRAMNMS